MRVAFFRQLVKALDVMKPTMATCALCFEAANEAAARRQFVQLATRQTCTTMALQIAELWNDVAQTLQSLSWLAGSTSGARGADGNATLTDVDKMRIQVQIDVQVFLMQCRALEADAPVGMPDVAAPLDGLTALASTDAERKLVDAVMALEPKLDDEADEGEA